MNVFTLVLALLTISAFVSVAGWALQRCAPEGETRLQFWVEWPWFAKGVLVPFTIWVLMNIGFSVELQPFMPIIQKAQNSGRPWFPVFQRVVTGGWLIIASCWAGLTLVWALGRAARGLREELRMEFRATCVMSIMLTGLPALLLLYLGGWSLIGLVTVLVCAPIVSYGAPILHRPKRRPMYSRAIARVKMGKYSDAEAEILRQLEKNENDFDGWLMLAELHATRFKELDEAERIILDICVQPDTTQSQISIALQKLADWQIQLAADPEAAARTLQLICDRLPGTHLAAMAAARKAQLPSNEQYYEQRHPKPIPVPEMPSIMNAASPLAAGRAETDAALDLINQLTHRLTQNPNSISDREHLARVLADPLGKGELAIEQLELLLELGDQPAVKQIEWLTLIANWQQQLLQDEAATRETLKKIVAQFPATPQAFTAQRRLSLLNAEQAARKS